MLQVSKLHQSAVSLKAPGPLQAAAGAAPHVGRLCDARLSGRLLRRLPAIGRERKRPSCNTFLPTPCRQTKGICLRRVAHAGLADEREGAAAARLREGVSPGSALSWSEVLLTGWTFNWSAPGVHLHLQGLCAMCIASQRPRARIAAPSPIHRVLIRFKDPETAMSAVRNLDEFDFYGRSHLAGLAMVADEASV